MKHLSIAQAIALVTVSLNLPATARPPSNISSSPEIRMAREELVGVPAEIGPARDAFEAYRRLQFEGDEFYSKHDKDIHRLHHRAYKDITRSVTGDRITFEEARTFLDRLVAIGEEHLEDEEESDSVTVPTIGKLEQLDSDIEEAITEYANPDSISPEIDRLYWLMEEATRFAETSDMSSSSTALLRQNLDQLIAEETDAKSDDSLSKSERHDLLRASARTWAGFVYIFRKNR